MASKSKRTGKRYSAQEKQEIIDSVQQHNAEHGRGGAATAANKFGVSTLTISNWMKAAGTPATPGKKKGPKSANPEKAPKEAKAPKAPKSSAVGPISGKRYTPDEKKEIINFVHQHNAEQGRGGATTAANKYGVSMLTISNWMKAAGTPATPGKKVKGGKAAKAPAAKAAKAVEEPSSDSGSDSGPRLSVLNTLAALDRQIAAKRKELDVLEAQFQKAKASL